ncbi:glutamine--tRNA ligase/YqeY domain fusion protein [Riemerella anatipestifer]|uniref:Glutamine--tRNA ligase n=1 Tax=Riemerella anatipestifer (strain ATCC 11845 / DSM 15868 / JCM 9532 / NCTC 11014) TaxID=693978 RepID=E4T9C2_RIEAD|nr:glutamine--tRNA ligase/YqeY domain fusion protein [Riemerella anatipestifer]ADQ81603.1 glutaminyl-tRNA synthetase [Riemerella anatipestifer ATCC 11845 = DSM 15868]ADZ12901.1 Glutamyl- and glutaminyl-tRNA synthetase [Riemerella anatipestifer RA-GD]AFD55620.1 glutaminyl-tRNA synthetase [Riemerella anatipestifer ATCC 11845 = DSM 15868]AGC40489.1 Glutamyl- and glutaminyl-tRNA synthetase [Riemerella anatipestifer RA-CH-2]AKP70726.1 glutaminyl-tRNA synthetase [Riemerella anatipestifer]
MEEKKSLNFIEQIIENDLENGLPKEKLRFRFPPEPNGYLHIGHTKAICINFGLGEKYNAPVNLRFDDTNPEKEEQEFVDSIKKDVEWLGFKWDKELYASDYFQQLYEWAVEMIKQGKAYVDEQPSEEITAQRKTPFEDGVESPYRDRPIEESLDLFERMKNGEFPEGSMSLRAKIDMTSPNMNMRDPVMYRILKRPHHRTGEQWKIYPMYDWAHGESDYLEQISHSLCSLEFENHRPLYEWYLSNVYEKGKNAPKQREFARMNVSYMITSKRKLQRLVAEKVVTGWDDPRMPTISGMRRLGYPPIAIKNFIERVGVTKRENLIDVQLLEFFVREELNKKAKRVMAVVDPVKLIIENYPENEEEWLETENNPEDENAGTRTVPFARELYIEREDFKEEANKKFFRLKLGGEVRLKSAYIIKAERVEKNENGEITTIYASYDPKSKSGSGTEESLRKVKGTLHWVSAKHALPIEVRIYDRLFTTAQPDAEKETDFLEYLNPDSLKVVQGYGEPSLKEVDTEAPLQFQRIGYFTKDQDSTEEKLVFNRTVTLKDSYKPE